MKTTIRLMLLPAALFAVASLNAVTVKVTSEEAEKLTDIRLSSTSEEKSLPVILDELRDGLNRAAKRYLPEDATIEIHFTDIDLAGEFEPWRTGAQYDIRWVREIYIPRLEFTYKITAADGAIIVEGEETLKDLAFMMRTTSAFDRSRPAFYETSMLNDWMRKFRKGEKS